MMTTILQMKRDEAVPAALLSLLLFLTVASMVIGKAARDAIFLSRFTALQMTAVDLATMVAIALAVAAQLRLNARLSIKRLLLLSPVCFALGDFSLWLGLSTSHGAWIAWAAYLWIGVQAALSAPHAFVLANHVLTIRQARRLCGPIGGGAILGWIGGGGGGPHPAGRGRAGGGPPPPPPPPPARPGGRLIELRGGGGGPRGAWA